MTPETFYHKLFRVTRHPLETNEFHPKPNETMHIETAIQELTAAIKESTATQRELLAAVLSNAAVAAVPTPAAEPKAAKTKKKEKPAPAPEPEPTPEAAPDPEPTPEATPEPEPEAPAAEPTPEPAAEPITIPELRNLIKAKLGEDANNRAKFDALREEFGIGTIKDLADDKIADFHKEVLTW